MLFQIKHEQTITKIVMKLFAMFLKIVSLIAHYFLTNCQLRNCDLINVDFTETIFDRCCFEKAKKESLVKAWFESCHFFETNFDDFKGASLIQTSVVDSKFSKFKKSFGDEIDCIRSFISSSDMSSTDKEVVSILACSIACLTNSISFVSRHNWVLNPIRLDEFVN